MKKIILLFIITFLLSIIAFGQNTFLPDNNFEQALIDLGYDTGSVNGYIPTANINSITTLNVSGKNISNLGGIEAFTSLTTLNCNNNNLTSLDLSQNLLLTILRCRDNSLINLDISLNDDLVEFNCKNNSLETLIVEDFNNSITVFDATNNPNLLCIQVHDILYAMAYWTNLDPASSFDQDCHFDDTYIPDDNFEQVFIDLGYDLYLDDYVETANINSIPILNISGKNISSLVGIEDFISLVVLNCNNNNLTNLDVSQNTLLNILRCRNNNIIDLDVAQHNSLIELNCNNNSLESLNVKNGNNTNFTVFEATGNPNLTCIEVDDVTYSNSNWPDIDASSYFSADCFFDDTYIPDDNFEQALIDLGYDTGALNDYVPTAIVNTITSLDINNKNILDITGIEDFISLNTLDCGNNQLTSLDISQSNDLTELICNNNQLTNLDLSQNTLLTQLTCNDNNLETLNVDNGLGSPNYTLFNSINNPNLICIEVNSLANFYRFWSWIDIDITSSFSTDCHYGESYIPGDNFEQALIDLGYDTGSLDNYILTQNINSITSLDVKNKNITDLTGIEYFTSLITLDCSDNQLISLDISQNTVLTQLSCKTNNLEDLNVANNNNANFTFFNATDNPNLDCIEVDDVDYSTTNWTNIDTTSGFSTDCLHYYETYVPDDNFEQALIDLGYDTGTLDDYVLTENINTITSLTVIHEDITDLTGIEDFVSLTTLICSDNQLTSLDVSQNTDLTYLSCSTNQLSSLDVSSNTALTILRCNANQLTSLDVSQHPTLTTLYCSGNAITNLNLSQNTLLTTLECDGNSLNSLDVSQNTALTHLDCDSNQLTSLDVSQNTVLENLSCLSNNLSSLDLASNTVLTYLSCFSNQLTSLDVSQNTALTYLSCSDNQLTSLDLNQNMTNLYCSDNQLTNLDVSQNTALINLQCYSNQLTNLDVSQNIALEDLDCNLNLLSNLNLGTNNTLTNISCTNNNLSGLDTSQTSALRSLDCSSNQLISLDLSQNTELDVLLCTNNQLTSLNIKNGYNEDILGVFSTNNPNLTCIEVDDETYSTTNWTLIDSQTSFSEDCAAVLNTNDETLLEKAVTIYPNPASEIIYLNSTIELDKIILYDLLGKEVLSTQETSQIKVDNIPSGMYLLKIFSENGFIVKQLIIE